MKRFREACPLVDLQIVPGAGHDATQLVLDGRVDVAIVSHDGGDARLTSQALFDDDVVVIVSSAHPFATHPRRCVEPHDFADQTLLLDMPHDRHAIYRRVVAADGIQPAAIQVVPQTGAMVELVKAGLGVGLIARWAVAPLVRSGDLRALPLTRTGVRHRWHGVYLNDLAEVAYVREFLVIATRGFLPLPRQGSDQR
jgi:LysR family transcriptional regulator for metE and metH